MLEACKGGRVVVEYIARVKAKHYAGTIPGAGVLRQQQHIRLETLGRTPKAKPGCQGNAQGIFRRQATYIEHDATESTCLQQQITHPQPLFQARPQLTLRACICAGSGKRSELRTRWS